MDAGSGEVQRWFRDQSWMVRPPRRLQEMQWKHAAAFNSGEFFQGAFEMVDDDTAVLLSHEIAREIEDQLEYPGQIKVTVIRETRAVDYAR